MRRSQVLFSLLAALTIASVASARVLSQKPEMSFWEVIQADSDCSMFVSLVNATNMTATVMDMTSATLLVPSNRAFALFFQATESDFDSLVADEMYAMDLVQYHIYGKAVSEDSLAVGEFLEMENGLQVYISKNPSDSLCLSDMLGRSALIASSDNTTAGASIFKITSVLIPKDAPNMAALFETLPGHYSFIHSTMAMFQWSSILMYANDTAVTFFAPVNDAFVYYAIHFEMDLYALLANTTVMESVIKAHMLSSAVETIDDLAAAGEKKVWDLDFEGASFTSRWSKNNNALILTGSGVIGSRWPFAFEGDLVAADSIIHGIDMLLVPEEFFGPYYADYTN